MEIIITGTNIEVTDAIHNYISKKLERLNNRGTNLTKIEVVFSTEKLKQIVRANVSLPRRKIIATASNEDLYAAIDILEDKLMRQLSDIHDRNND